MYVMVYRGPNDPHGMLEEMTVPEFNRITGEKFGRYLRDEEDEDAFPQYRQVSSEQARRMVKEGAIHNTKLYVDDTGKVRKNID